MPKRRMTPARRRQIILWSAAGRRSRHRNKLPGGPTFAAVKVFPNGRRYISVGQSPGARARAKMNYGGSSLVSGPRRNTAYPHGRGGPGPIMYR